MPNKLKARQKSRKNAGKKFKRKKASPKRKSLKKPKKIRAKKRQFLPIDKTPPNRIAKKGATPSGLPSSPAFLAESFFKAKIKVMGVGGGGASIVSEIGRSLGKATFIIADTDARSLKKKPGIKYFLFGKSVTHGLGSGLNPELAKTAALQEQEKISHLFDNQDIVIFIACLGGGVASGATPVFVEALKNFKGITVGIFTLPFRFEGKNKYKIALKALSSLQKSLNVSITIPNERIFKVIDSNTAITDAFSLVNKGLTQSLESLIDLIYSPGIINIDFADIKAILQGKGNIGFLNTVQAQGKTKAQTIIKTMLVNPLYQNLPLGQDNRGNFVATKIIFNVAGGSDMSMLEVDQISKAILALNPKAKIIFGISRNAKYKNKIKTTLLMTGGQDVAAKETPVSPVPISKKNTPKKSKKTKASVKISRKQKSSQKRRSSVSVSPEESFSAPKIPPVFTDRSFEDNIGVAAETISQDSQKKAVRRNALEIRKAKEKEEGEQSLQEKEWEIPAFLRKVKFK